MPKTKVTKKHISITIDIGLLEKLKTECDDRTMKMSSYLEKLVKIGYENEKINSGNKRIKDENFEQPK